MEPRYEREMTDKQRYALAAAQEGNWGPADELELAFLNGNDEIKGVVRDHLRVDDNSNIMATDILRNFAPGGQLGVRWAAECEFCKGSGKIDVQGDKKNIEVDCPDCDGIGEDDDFDDVYTDIDGNMIERPA